MIIISVPHFISHGSTVVSRTWIPISLPPSVNAMLSYPPVHFTAQLQGRSNNPLRHRAFPRYVARIHSSNAASKDWKLPKRRFLEKGAQTSPSIVIFTPIISPAHHAPGHAVDIPRLVDCEFIICRFRFRLRSWQRRDRGRGGSFVQGLIAILHPGLRGIQRCLLWYRVYLLLAAHSLWSWWCCWGRGRR